MEEIDQLRFEDNAYCISNDFIKKYHQRRDDICYIDETIYQYIKKIHIIEIKYGHQYIIYPNLHCNVHYSISNNHHINKIISKANKYNIDIHIYDKERDHTCPENNKVLIFNNMHMYDLIINEDKELLMKEINKYKTHARNNAIGFHIGVSGTNAKGWTQPHPELNKYARNGVLNKEGYSNTIPESIRHIIGKTLYNMAMLLKLTYKKYDKNVYHDEYRQSLFSDNIAKLLNVQSPIYFEGCSIYKNKQGIPPHIDELNCKEEGYNYTGVYSFHENNERYTIIGYSRKAAHNYLKRLKEAQEKRKKSI